MIQNKEFIQEFVEEAKVHIEDVETGLLELAQGGDEEEHVDMLFRSVHSIKGTAGFFGLDNIVALAHAMESLLGAIRNDRISLEDSFIDVLLEANDCLSLMVGDVFNVDKIDIKPYTDRLDAVLKGNSESGKRKKADQRGGAATKNISPKNAPASSGEDSIRVTVGLLNDLMNLAGELVLGRNQLLRGLENHRKNVEGIEPILQNIDHITTQLQGKIMQTRMQPLGNVFNKFPRLIRELSKQLEKEIILKVKGTQVELDRSIIEALADPLTHLIRNAADHGIEKVQERENAGKDRVGYIFIHAYQEGGYVSILVSDDGGGIDIEALKSRILKQELKTHQELSSMEEKEILDLIFLPGISTAHSVTGVSGRGIGMDVVRTNIEKMGGTIEIDSKVGEGTTFKLNLPLTLAIIPALIVEARGHCFALPQANLQEMVRVKPGEEDRRLEYIRDSLVLRFRGKFLPVLSLSQVLGLNTGTEEGEIPGGISRILVLKMGEKRFGLLVDAIHDDEEILVKPLPRHLKHLRYYSGSTILGNGTIAMILDADGIAAEAELKFFGDIEKPGKKVTIEEVIQDRHNILLFSASGPEVLGLNLSLVSRMEEIRPQDIQIIGDKEYMQFRGGTLRLVRPENYLPIAADESTGSKCYVIVPKLAKRPIGIVISKIHDTAVLDVDLNRKEIKAKGIMGTTYWKERIVLMLNLYQLFGMAAPEYYDNPLP